MRIITDKTKNEIGKRLSAIYYIALHGYGKDTASDTDSTTKIIENLHEIAYKVGGERFSNIEMSAYVLKLQRAIQREKRSGSGGRRMRTITYTYDEENPTNRDYLIAALTDSIDDGGASYDSAVEYNIDCPYIRSADCLNEYEGNDYKTAAYDDGCLRCKLSWLNRRYDTYPSDDGRWEIEGEE